MARLAYTGRAICFDSTLLHLLHYEIEMIRSRGEEADQYGSHTRFYDLAVPISHYGKIE